MANYKFKDKIQADAGVQLTDETASRALQLDGSGNVEASSVTTTELGYLSGVTSAIQDQIDDITTDVSDLVTLSGVAANATDLGTFTGDIIPDASNNKEALQALESAIEALPDPITYEGTWDASTNTPTLADGVGNVGDLYQVNVAGTQDLGSGSISFEVGDKVVYNGTTWDKWDMTDAVSSVFGRTGTVTAQSGDYDTSQVTESTNLYFTDERAQDAVGSILVDSSSIDFTYDDGTPSITAVVLPGGVDHDQLLNYVANEHIDHSSVSIATGVDSGLTGGGDITSTRNISVDINGTTAETSPASDDELLIWDTSVSALRKMTRANLLAGISIASAGDINETSFSADNDVSVAEDVTGLAFANGVVRSFKAQVSVAIDATADLFETFELIGVQKGASWDMAVSAVGDDSGIVFSITSAGQVQYTSTDVAGFSSNDMKFRATTTSV